MTVERLFFFFFFLLSTFSSKYLFKAYIFYIWEEDIPFSDSFSYFSDTITVFPTLMSGENHVSPDVFLFRMFVINWRTTCSFIVYFLRHKPF